MVVSSRSHAAGRLPRCVWSPVDIAGLTLDELEHLAGRLRKRIIETVDRNGGHLGSNLGTVELTLGLHRAFDLRCDRILWDVSHQAYVHKLLTGREERFDTLRTAGGLSGFTNKRESPFDLFDAGHAGTAVSTAAGLAVADRLEGRSGKTIVVVGDASCACGVTFEGLNHVGAIRPNLLVILNDNRMSISHSVGAFAQYLQRIRTTPFWRDLVGEIHKTLHRIPLVGKQVDATLEKLREAACHSLVPGLLFQELGFAYYGPVDGHDLKSLMTVLHNIRPMEQPVLLHVYTEKGRGYAPATEDPASYHGCKGFLSGPKAGGGGRPAYTKVFGEALCALGRANPRLCAVTAAMADGTGVNDFNREFPDRTFDVGIAEEHGACFASGLSFGGRPTV